MTAFGHRRMLAVLLLIVATLGGRANAQVTGTTGAIIGTVADNTKAVIPGVTITASAPTLMGTRTVVTGVDGTYRIPALPPGTYTLVFELSGFQTVTREGIQIRLGFTATINTELSPASLAETITVSGASPVVDLASTTVSTNVGAEQMGNLMGSRDHAAVMALVPAVSMTRSDVGGAGANAYQKYTAYGIDKQNRGEVEGMVTTESSCTGNSAGTCGEIFYSDYNSFEDMAVTVVGNTAEMPQAGTLTVVVAKSGGNTYRGKFYADYQTESWQSTNIDAQQLALGVRGGGSVKDTDVNRLVSFRDLNVDMGGYVTKDKLWWYGAYRIMNLSRRYPNLTDDIYKSSIGVTTGKATYNLSLNNKLIAYYARSTKKGNHDIAFASTITDRESDRHQVWPSGAWKGEYSAVLGNAGVVEVRAGKYYERGIYDPNDSVGKPRYQDSGVNQVIGNAGSSRSWHDRPQANGSLTLFKDGWAGSHTFKFGSEVMRTTNSSRATVFNNVVMVLNNGAPTQVQLYLPSNLSISRLQSIGAYVQDAWKVNSRLTLNLGLRFDRYLSYSPRQTGANGQHFEEFRAPIWNNPAPRLGFVYALTDDGKTLVKTSYGRFWNFPFNDISRQINPNPSSNFSTYAWTPTNPVISNGRPIYTPGEEGRLLSVTGPRPDGRPATTIDPNFKNTYSKQLTAYFEREVAPNFGMRTGFVWNAWRRSFSVVNRNAPYEAYTVPVTVIDPGRDGIAGNSDDGQPVRAFNLDPAYLGLPPDQVLQNQSLANSDFYTWEITANRRQTGRWSLVASFAKTWNHAGAMPLGNTSALLYTPNTLINTEDGRYVYSDWIAKINGAVEVGAGVRLSPVLRIQQGSAFARTFTARLNFNSSVLVNAEQKGAERTDNLALLDVRAERIFKVKRASISAFFDLYNITNTNAGQALVTSSGSAFLRPTVITGPRIARFGARFDF